MKTNEQSARFFRDSDHTRDRLQPDKKVAFVAAE
jgi:hypothetical protein